MGLYFMFGRYSPEALRAISARRTEEVSEIVKQCKGELQSVYALLGQHDIVMLAEFPGTQQAMTASLALCRHTGISFSTAPAVEVGEFDKLAATL